MDIGNRNETVMVVATFPKQHESELSEKLRASLLTVTWDSEKSVSPTEGMSFTLGEIGIACLYVRRFYLGYHIGFSFYPVDDSCDGI